MNGEQGELRCTVTITRKETGKVETYQFVGRIEARQPVVHGATGSLAGEPAQLSNEGETK